MWVARSLVAAASVLVASQARAEQVYAPWMPPSVYHHAYKGPGALSTVNVPVYAVRSICRATAGRIVFACAFKTAKGCLIVMPQIGFLSAPRYRALWFHERGHCNGWPRNHPRTRTSKVKP